MSSNGIWFLNTLVKIRVAGDDGTDGLSVLEHRAPAGDSPPLHSPDGGRDVSCSRGRLYVQGRRGNR